MSEVRRANNDADSRTWRRFLGACGFLLLRSGESSDAFLCIIHVDYTVGEGDTYVVPLMVAGEEKAEALLSDHPNAGVAWLDSPKRGTTLLYDAMVDPTFAQATLEAFRRRAVDLDQLGEVPLTGERVLYRLQVHPVSVRGELDAVAQAGG